MFSATDQVRAYVESLASRRPVWDRGIGKLRREVREYSLARSGTPESVASVEELSTRGVPARLYRSVVGERSVLVWLHGGSWMFGDLDCYDAIARALSNRARCAVLAVDYRLAPEHPYPAGLEDCWVATEWALDRFDRVAVGGDSAGGNLSAAVALRGRDRRRELALQLLVYPPLDYAAVNSPSYDEFRHRYSLFAGMQGFGARCQDGFRHIWEVYVPEPGRRFEPEASPLQAGSLAGVAPAVIITAEHDILRGENEEYARRLAAAGVAAEVWEYEGQVHGFFQVPGVMDDARDAIERSAASLRTAFADAGNLPGISREARAR